MSIKQKLFLGVAVSLLIIFSLFSVYTFTATSNTVIEKELEMLETLGQAVGVQMDEQIETSMVGAVSLAKNLTVSKLFASGNREELSVMLLPTFQAISDQVSQIQFHLPDSTSFLRLHQPEKFGDSLKDFRFTVNEANIEKRIISGLEEGVAGFGFRVVVPMSYEGQHIGTVEYGSDFGNTFLEAMQSSYGGEYFIYRFDSNEASGVSLLSSTLDDDSWEINQSGFQDQLKDNKALYLQSQDKKIQHHINTF